MNSLSLLIILANLSERLEIVTFIFGAALGIYFLVSFVLYDISYSGEKYQYKKILIGFGVLVAMIALNPGKQAILMVAASEYGGNLVTSDRVTNVIDPSMEYLAEWIKSQTEHLKKDKK